MPVNIEDIIASSEMRNGGKGYLTAPDKKTANEMAKRLGEKTPDHNAYRTNIEARPNGTFRVHVLGEIAEKDIIKKKTIERATGRMEAKLEFEKDLGETGFEYKNRQDAVTTAKAIEAQGYKTVISKTDDGMNKVVIKDALSNETVTIDKSEVRKWVNDYTGAVNKIKADNGTNVGITNRHQMQSIQSVMANKGLSTELKTNADGTYNAIFTDINTGMRRYVSNDEIQKALKEGGANLKVSKTTAIKTYAKLGKKQAGKSVELALKEVGGRSKEMVGDEVSGSLNTMADRMQGSNNPAKKLAKQGNVPVSGRHPMISNGYGYDTQEGREPKIKVNTTSPRIADVQYNIGDVERLDNQPSNSKSVSGIMKSKLDFTSGWKKPNVESETIVSKGTL